MVALKFKNEAWSNEQIKAMMEQIKIYAYRNKFKIESIDMDNDDFQQEILTKMCTQKSYTANYDADKNAFKAYMKQVCYRTHGDNLRKKNQKRNTLPNTNYNRPQDDAEIDYNNMKNIVPKLHSLSMQIGHDEESSTLEDILESGIYIETKLIPEYLNKIISVLPDYDLYPIIKFSYEDLFMHLMSFEVPEILKIINEKIEEHNTINYEQMQIAFINLKNLKQEYKKYELSEKQYSKLPLTSQDYYNKKMQGLNEKIHETTLLLSNYQNQIMKNITKAELQDEINELHDYINFQL